MSGAMESLREAAMLAEAFATAEHALKIEAISGRMASCLKGGGKIIACGNGGSLCDAAHFAEELTGRFRADRPPLAALAVADPGHLTCVSNDYGFDQVFSRAVEGLGRPGDILVVLTTSGNSPNVVRAVEAARRAGMVTVALLGKGGGDLRGKCDEEIVAPGGTSDRIQELHMLVLHILVQQVETLLGFARRG